MADKTVEFAETTEDISRSPSPDDTEDEDDDEEIVEPDWEDDVPTKKENLVHVYVEPLEDPYKKAISYLEEHNILQLFQTITAGIVYKKPVDPIQYMIEEVENLKEDGSYKTTPTPSE